MTIANIEILTRFLTKTNTTTLTAPQLLILDNKYYEDVVGRIISATAGSEWQFGDVNFTAFPQFTLDMTDSTEQYDFLNDIITQTPSPAPLTASGILTVMGVEVLDNDGTWHVLRRITLDHIHNEHRQGRADYQSTDGRPLEYELRDNFIVLYPAPDNGVSVTLSDGLKIFYLRTADIFTSSEVTTGTKEPGFPRPWHDLMAYGPAYDYALANGLPNADRFLREYERKLSNMIEFITRRDQAEQPRMRGRGIMYE